MTKLSRISIKNFRQYRKLEMSFDSDTGIYLFIGKNGMGKSNFLNAICWCLYEELPFKSHDLGDNISSVYNEEAYKEATDKMVSAEVSIEVIIDGTVFKFQRQLHNLPIGNTETIFKAFRRDKNDWLEIPNATHYIDNFLPKSLRQFFLFDGEGVRGLFKGQYSHNLKSSIWKIAHIDLLNTAIEHMESVASELRKTLAHEIPQLEATNQLIDDYQRRLNNSKNILEEKKLAQKDLESNLHQLSQKFKLNSRYRELQLKRESLIDQKAIITNELEDLRKELSGSYVFYGPFLLASKTLLEYTDQINSQRKRGMIPAEIKPTLISDLLESHSCICGKKIDDEAKKHLEDLLEKNQNADEKEFLVSDSYVLGNLNSQLATNNQIIISRRKRIRVQEQKIENIEKELKEISDQLVDSPDIEIGSIETQIRVMQDENTKLALSISELTNGIKEDEFNLKTQKEKLEKIAVAQKKLSEDTERLKLLNSTIETAREILGKVIDQVRKNVSFKTNEYFHNLVWKKDFEKVEFTPEYKILIHKLGVDEPIDHTRLGNGETKVLGFATIKALTDISGFENFPAFIDAPVEQLDQEVENNLLSLLPDFMPTKQVFVFSLDSESIIRFGKEMVAKDMFFKLERDSGSLSTVIKNYYD